MKLNIKHIAEEILNTGADLSRYGVLDEKMLEVLDKEYNLSEIIQEMIDGLTHPEPQTEEQYKERL